MKYYLVALMVLILPAGVWAQDLGPVAEQLPQGELIEQEAMQLHEPNFEEIADQTSDPASPYFYDLLMYRYNAGDTLLNVVDYYNLYYGYSLQAEYNPEYQSIYRDSVALVLNVDRKIELKDYSLLEYYMQKILERIPFSIRDLNALAFVYENMGQTGKALEQMYKVELITHTIKCSGTGKTKDSPWTVIFRENATDVLTLLGFSSIRETIITADVSYLGQTAAPNVRKMGYFFNFEPINLYLAEVAKQQATNTRPPKRKMEFNSKYNPRSENNILPKNKKKRYE